MTARGKREARRPWFINTTRDRGLKGRNNTGPITPFQGSKLLFVLTRGDALRACPWLSYLAPLAPSGVRAPWAWSRARRYREMLSSGELRIGAPRTVMVNCSSPGGKPSGNLTTMNDAFRPGTPVTLPTLHRGPTCADQRKPENSAALV